MRGTACATMTYSSAHVQSESLIFYR